MVGSCLSTLCLGWCYHSCCFLVPVIFGKVCYFWTEILCFLLFWVFCFTQFICSAEVPGQGGGILFGVYVIWGCILFLGGLFYNATALGYFVNGLDFIFIKFFCDAHRSGHFAVDVHFPKNFEVCLRTSNFFVVMWTCELWIVRVLPSHSKKITQGWGSVWVSRQSEGVGVWFKSRKIAPASYPQHTLKTTHTCYFCIYVITTFICHVI